MDFDKISKTIISDIIRKRKESNEKFSDQGDTLIAYTEFGPRYGINKSVVKSFKNKQEKIEYRQQLFLDIKNHAHYKKWFADKNKKGHIWQTQIDFILEWIKRTVDLDYNEFAIANRNLIIDSKLKSLVANASHVDELLTCMVHRIRTQEEGVFDLPYTMRTDYPLRMKKS